jgi:hypothetical protein
MREAPFGVMTGSGSLIFERSRRGVQRERSWNRYLGAPPKSHRRDVRGAPYGGEVTMPKAPSSLAGMRLALLAPISWPVPPAGYGPWEQVAFDIAEGMRERGLDVTLFATGNSQTQCKLDYVVPVGINEDPALDGDVYGALHIANLFARARDFDLIHNNFDWKPLTYALATSAPAMLTTIHGFSTPQILAA